MIYSFQIVIPPEVTLEPITEVYVGDKGQLHCKIKVPLPVPQREWTKVNGEMPEKSRYIETDDGKLIISKVQESDSGTYKCFTRNKAGEMSVLGKLMVYSKSFISFSKQVWGCAVFCKWNFQNKYEDVLYFVSGIFIAAKWPQNWHNL